MYAVLARGIFWTCNSYADALKCIGDCVLLGIPYKLFKEV